MRIGEASAIQWSDIDFETGVLTIDKNLHYKSQTNHQFVKTKTNTSERQIVLDTDTLDYLKEWQKVQSAVVSTGFVMSHNGIPTQKHTLPRAIEKLSKQARVPRIRLHASLLIRMGENPLIIKERLGHEDIETTLSTYGHLYPNSNFVVTTKLKGIMTFTHTSENTNDSQKNKHTERYLGKTIKNNAMTMQ